VQEAKPLIEWPEPFFHLAEYVGIFLAAGAVGFRFAALRKGWAGDPGEERTLYGHAARRAAGLGIVGSLITLALFFHDLPEIAARQHVATGQALHGDTLANLILLVLGLIGFALSAAGQGAGWWLALIGVIGAQLRGVFFGPITRMVNPVHILVAALWIGTLFVLVSVGLSIVLSDEPNRARRGAITADMVNGFSPLALTCGMILVASGLTTAWTHLKSLDALWTTPYGYALIAKLCVVAVVFGLGAWNWRRQRPTLGSEDAARSIRRSSTGELVAAGIVLLITTILVSLPAPRKGSGPPPGSPPAEVH
jgi:putative copper export protein